MKKILLLIASAAIALAVNAAPQKVDFGKLPKNSQEFIQKNFPGEKVKAVEMDREASWDKYTVYFNSGNQVSFEGGSGDCSQIIKQSSLEFEGQHTQHCLINLGFLYKTSAYCFFQFAKRLIPPRSWMV